MTPPDLSIMEPLTSRERLIVALDVGGEAAALRMVELLAGTAGFFKIGLELFTLAGPAVVGRVRAVAGPDTGIFLDLKFHDIPNTVGRAVASAVELGVELLTVHLGGGAAMLAAAVRGAAAPGGGDGGRRSPRVLGVSVLTSSTEETLRETGVEHGSVADQVLRLARLGVTAGVGGLVASPLEIAPLRQAFGPGLRLVIPGVRPAWASVGLGDDQRRVLSPREALAAGADHLVIGRPITGAVDPRTAAGRVLEELAG